MKPFILKLMIKELIEENRRLNEKMEEQLLNLVKCDGEYLLKKRPELMCIFLSEELTDEMKTTLKEKHPFLYDLKLWALNRTTELIEKVEYFKKEYEDYYPNIAGIRHFARLKITFTNNYGILITRGSFTYGGEHGLFEIAPLDQDGAISVEILRDEFEDKNIKGNLTSIDVHHFINKISNI